MKRAHALCLTTVALLTSAAGCSSADDRELSTSEEALTDDGGAAPASTGPTVDPFDPASCAGARITASEAVARFEPGTTATLVASTITVRSRFRDCNTATGCGPWFATDQIPYTFWSRSEHSATTHETRFVSIPDGAYDSGARFVVHDNGRIFLDVAASSGGQGFFVETKVAGPSVPYLGTYVGPCTGTFCISDVNYPYPPGGGGNLSQVIRPVVTNHCFRFGGTVTLAQTSHRREYQMAVHGTL